MLARGLLSLLELSVVGALIVNVPAIEQPHQLLAPLARSAPDSALIFPRATSLYVADLLDDFAASESAKNAEVEARVRAAGGTGHDTSGCDQLSAENAYAGCRQEEGDCRAAGKG